MRRTESPEDDRPTAFSSIRTSARFYASTGSGSPFSIGMPTRFPHSVHDPS
jgi:hypothetical protein